MHRGLTMSSTLSRAPPEGTAENSKLLSRPPGMPGERIEPGPAETELVLHRKENCAPHDGTIQRGQEAAYEVDCKGRRKNNPALSILGGMNLLSESDSELVRGGSQ